MGFQIKNGVLEKYIPEDGETEVTIPEGVTKIASEAFQGCQSLSSVTIPDSVTEIGLRAFSGCTGLKSLTIPDTPQEMCIEGNAFSDCHNVTYRGIVLMETMGRFMNVNHLLDIVRNKRFDNEIPELFKYPILWQMFCQDPEDAEVFAYIREHFLRLFVLAIMTGHTEVVEAACQNGNLITSENIEIFLPLAIARGQLDMQLLLMNYKNEKIGFDKKKLKL